MDKFAKEIFRVAKEDKELLEFYTLTKDSEPYKIVSAYILHYFPLYVSKEICKNLVYALVNQEDRK